MATSLLRDKVYGKLKKQLIKGSLGPGTFLSARKLAAQLGVSNTPVRSALERLEAEGFVTVSPQQGIIIHELSVAQINDHFGIREALECSVVRKLTNGLTTEQTELLHDNLQNQQERLDQRDVMRSMEVDSQFHLLMCEFLGNEEIIRAMLRIRDNYFRMTLRAAKQDWDRMKTSVEEHHGIAKAVIKGDGALAAKLVAGHLENSRRCILMPET